MSDNDDNRPHRKPIFDDRPHTPLLFDEQTASNHEGVVRLRRTKDDYRQFLNGLIAKLNKYVGLAKTGDFINLFNDERDMRVISSDVSTARRLSEYKAELSGIVDELLDLLKRNWSQDEYRLLENNIQEELSEHLKKEKANKGYNSEIRTTLPLTPYFQSPEEYMIWYNERHFAVKMNGAMRAGSESDGDFMKKSDFFDLYVGSKFNTGTTDKPKLECTAKLWFDDSRRRTYKGGLTFDPSRIYAVDEDQYNLFKGYQIIPREGVCKIFLDYMKDIICSGNERNYKYLLALIAQMFQKPGDKPGVAVALRGDEGVGKSFFIEKLGALMGPYYFKTSNPAYVFGDHNSQLKNKLLMHLEEAVFAGSKKEDSQMKDLITSPTLQIDEKFIPLYSVTNHLHFFLSGNPDHLVRAGFESRRILALHVSDARRVDTDYFAGIDEWFKSGGAENLMHYFLHHKWEAALVEIDIKDLRNVPVTEELIYQRKQTASGLEKWALNSCEELNLPYGDVKEDGTVHVIKTLLVHAYNNSPEGKRQQLSENEFGNRFLALFPKVVNGEIPKHKNRKPVSIITGGRDYKIKDCNGRPQYAYIIPASDECRSALDFKLSGKSDVKNDWDNSEKWSTSAGNDSKDIEDIYNYHRKF
jgi:Family of unknown function (DUF5906)